MHLFMSLDFKPFKLINLLFSLFIVAVLVEQCLAECYFPMELQGLYRMQSISESNLVEPNHYNYDTVNITADSIISFGKCHKRIGNNFIVIETITEKSSTGPDGYVHCFRCFHLKLKSQNILLVYSQAHIFSKCSFEESEHVICPKPDEIGDPGFTHTEMILYKVKNIRGYPVEQEYCPMQGTYSFKYYPRGIHHNETEITGNNQPLVDLCPGYRMNMHYRGASVFYQDLIFQCFGSWERKDGLKYLALLQTGSMAAKYRCGTYVEDASGDITITLSKDATCHLETYVDDYEAYKLTPLPAPEWPEVVKQKQCRFPKWLRGTWQHVVVNDATIVYKNHTSYKTYTMKCFGKSQSTDTDAIYHVYSSTQCGEEEYECVWFKRRSLNVIEFQRGLRASKTFDPDLCNVTNFDKTTWTTQARVIKEQQSPCPVVGQYTGRLPDNEEYCTNLTSDCQSPEIMYYKVSDCSRQEVVEERKYKCLGQWEEDKLIYTYTQRNDLSDHTYECFVGTMLPDHVISIKEAGETCQRDIGQMAPMKLYKNGDCSPTAAVVTTMATTTVKQRTGPSSTEFDHGVAAASAIFNVFTVFLMTVTIITTKLAM